MLLIVGLGNPGPEYVAQRHNVGFMAVDAIRSRRDPRVLMDLLLSPPIA